ncbi:MAG TPA: hypothetical protein VFD48_02105 [Pyrinomonadaceae bacterium]|nr:hypothetical protein [Pyrinomonadaceae bacterium]
MNRNQKIALGCGGAGCLGLLVVLVAAAALYFFYYERRAYTPTRNSNFSLNANRDSNNNSSSNSSNSGDEPSSSMSDDDKHKLFQAAGATQDNELILKVLKKIGFGSGTGPAYEEFVKDHFEWALKNLQFISSVNTPEKARAYVEEHLDD